MTKQAESVPVAGRATLIAAMLQAARDAGALILDIYNGEFATETKADGSPVTAADRAAETLILSRLKVAAPLIPVISEENAASHGLAAPTCFFLVDPLDGTKEFIGRNGEFTVNIALVESGVPTLGVVYAPVPDAIYWVDDEGRANEGTADGQRIISARRAPASGWTAAVSRSHLDAPTETFLRGFPIAERISAGSSLKFTHIARGLADIYPRFGPTHEWDTAAGDAVLRAAGGRVEQPGGRPFTYGKPRYRNGPYVAYGAKPNV